MTSPTTESTKPDPFKRPVFKKTNPQMAFDDEDLFFSRRNERFTAVIAEEQERKKKKYAKKQQEKEKEGSGEPESKKRRISNEHEYTGESKVGLLLAEQATEQVIPPAESEYPSYRKSPSPQRSKSSPRSLKELYEDKVAAFVAERTQMGNSSTVINLDDSESEDELQLKGANSPEVSFQTTSLPEDEEPMDSDEEFPELVRKAREAARKKRLDAESGPKPASGSPQSEPQETYTQRSDSVLRATPPQILDPVVAILITSPIANTKPLIVNRRLGQRLKDVRQTWCSYQNFEPEAAHNVILTWKGKRLYDVTTCKSLGIGLDSGGNIATNGENDILSEDDSKIHMEAMTEEMFEEQKRLKEQVTQEMDANGDGEHQSDRGSPPPAQESTIKVILKAKGIKDFKLIVKPSTFISRMLVAFRGSYEVPLDKEVYLMFDGERLDPAMSVGDTDISDMDNIDVYVK